MKIKVDGYKLIFLGGLIFLISVEIYGFFALQEMINVLNIQELSMVPLTYLAFCVFLVVMYILRFLGGLIFLISVVWRRKEEMRRCEDETKV